MDFVFRLLRLLAEEVGEAEEFLAEPADVARYAIGHAALDALANADNDGE